jgi:hypothetical protein
MSALEDGKSGADSSGKAIALDHLGGIAAKLRSLHLAMNQGESVPSLDEVSNVSLLRYLAHDSRSSHLRMWMIPPNCSKRNQ